MPHDSNCGHVILCFIALDRIEWEMDDELGVEKCVNVLYLLAYLSCLPIVVKHRFLSGLCRVMFYYTLLRWVWFYMCRV